MQSNREKPARLFRTVRRTIAATVALLFASQARALVPSDATLVSDKMIWNQAPYNSFTDLAYYDGNFYATFREASQHLVPPVGTHGGEIRILRSPDGSNWSSAALISMNSNDDLRDPKLSVTPSGQLMLLSSDSHEDGTIRQNYTWFSSDGTIWSAPTTVGEPGWWLWRVVWHGNEGFGISYNTNETRIYTTTDGKKFTTSVSSLVSGDEAGLLFEPNGVAISLVRSDTGDELSSVGVAFGNNYTNWTFKKSNLFVGGPNIIQLPDGRIVAAGRLTNGTERTSLMFLDPATGDLSEFMTLPSGGDTGYPGLVWQDNALWVSYYGSQTGQASVYMAEVKFADLVPEPATGGLIALSSAWFFRRPKRSAK
jgi:hypothetical protein